MYGTSQQLGSEVERQGKAHKSTTPRTALSFQRKEEELPWVQSRQALYDEVSTDKGEPNNSTTPRVATISLNPGQLLFEPTTLCTVGECSY